MRRIKKYGSTDLEKSFEHSQPEEIINQTYCKCSFIIEPVVFLQTIASSIIGIAFGQFIYARILNRLISNESLEPIDINNSTIINNYTYLYTPRITSNNLWNTNLFEPIINNNDKFVCNLTTNTTLPPSDSDLIRIKAQKETANFFFISSLFGGLPCIFTTNLLGVNCSKLGRKFLLIIGLSVMTLRCIIFLFLSIYPSLPDYLFYICALIDGLSGSNGLFYLVLHCYIADLTTVKNRSYRLTFINYIGSISNLLISYACGYVIKYLGYIYIFASSLLFYFLALIYLIIFVPEPLIHVRSKCLIERLKSCSLKRIKNSVYVLMRETHPIFVNKKRIENENDDEESPLVVNNDVDNNEFNDCGTTRQRCVILLVIFANLIYCAGTNGISSIFTLYIMNLPFCWDSVHISNYSLYSTLVAFFLSLIVSRFIRINDIIISIISASSYFASLFLFAFATNSFGIYLGATIGALGGLEYGYVRSLVSKLVTKHEVADALTFIAFIDTFTGVIANIIFPLIYGKLVDNQIKILFYISAVIVFITIISHIIARSIYKKPSFVKNSSVQSQNENLIEDLSIGNASIENVDSFFQNNTVPSQVDSISQIYVSLAIASHESEDNNNLISST